MTTMTKGVALVTGGTRGIGLGIAQALAREGWRLALCGLRPAGQVQDVLADLRSLGTQVLYLSADIASENDRQVLLDTIWDDFGRLDALVNNAGIAPRSRADILEAQEDVFDEVVRTNLRGPYFLTQAAVRRMLATDAGAGVHRSVVFVGSVSARVASLNRGEYCVSKAGLAMAAQLWALRLAAHGIAVYEVRPGLIATDMTSGVRETYDDLIKAGRVPERRWGQPDDVGRVVATLLRGDLPYATGSVVSVDGGLALDTL